MSDWTKLRNPVSEPGFINGNPVSDPGFIYGNPASEPGFMNGNPVSEPGFRNGKGNNFCAIIFSLNSIIF